MSAGLVALGPRDVDLLFRLPVRELDVLFAGALPTWFRVLGFANPITWHVDVLRYLTVGLGRPTVVAAEALAFALFTLCGFLAAV